jgi:hypothetical protein
MFTVPARRAVVDRILIYVSKGNMSTVPARRAVVDEIFTIIQGRNSHLQTELFATVTAGAGPGR